MDESEEFLDTETPETKFIQKEREQEVQKRLIKLLKEINDREKYVLSMHILPDEPMTTREIADVWKCGQASIIRDKKRILTRLGIDDD